MNRFTDIYAPIIGRILVGGFFLWEGIQNTLNFPSATGFLTDTGLFGASAWVVAMLFVATEVLGGLSLIVGYKSRITALILALYVVVTSPLYLLDTALGGVALQFFLQSMAIVGGLLYISAFGNGKWSR